ncbi:murein L,D-transpeptidase [Hyphomonas sp. WL0036]|uniref:L,D-transpeptidase family protein n=1 Tax=Hyphomonas sediminis TaxID=2866160 RepID=UPI001C7FBC4E|nr:murein L,D-transpeptidase family protein [Hyphomonas sediminis]MBY9065570.1 murein L,D-transpeptidase [Hyphomonas sediminis]
MSQRRPKYRRRPRPNILAILIAMLGFLCLPALFAFAHSETVPETARSRAAYTAQEALLKTALSEKGLALGSPVFLQVTKEPAQLTAYVQDTEGRFQPFRSWPVCAVSGGLGPKMREGDGQAPEGFYAIKPGQMNPASSFHLSFNLGYPNAFDRANGRTGSFLMVHGACASIGCFAMTDPVIEEIWTLMEAALEKGQTSVPVHIFPFPMTEANMAAHSSSEHAAFWQSLKPAWDAFANSGKVPTVSVLNATYQVR